jgi:hypothetical protein
MRAALVLTCVALAGGCTRPGTPRSDIGAPCRDDATCGTGPRYFCATDHPGGYCESACRWDSDCAGGSVCVGGGILSKGGCHQACGEAPLAACRGKEGYRCIAHGADATHDYCDPPGRSEIARRIRGRAWRW